MRNRTEPKAQAPTLEAAVAELERLAGDNPHPDEIPKALRRLRTALDAHCTLMEQPGGGFEEMLDETPRLTHNIAELRIEHSVARSSLDNLIEMVEHAPSLHHPALLVAMIGRVRLLVESIERHHRHAADAMHQAYVADTGAID